MNICWASTRSSLAGVILLLTLAGPALAHGLLMTVEADGAFIAGKVYYTSGEPGAGEWVQLTDLSSPAAQPQSMQTDAEGSFRFAGAQGRRYRLLAEGEEGHVTEMQLTMTDRARGRFVDRDAATAKPNAPPAWLIIGAVLALSIGPALVFRKRATWRRG